MRMIGLTAINANRNRKMSGKDKIIMTFKKARQLHNGDEVIVKETGEIATVISAYTNYVGNKPKVFVETRLMDYGYTTLSHTEIR